jgi:hypothetical protein
MAIFFQHSSSRLASTFHLLVILDPETSAYRSDTPRSEGEPTEEVGFAQKGISQTLSSQT